MELITVAEFATSADAEMARNFLEANGIPACVSGSIHGISTTKGLPLGSIVQVTEADRERALELLRNASKPHRTTPPSVTWQDTLLRTVFWGLAAAGIALLLIVIVAALLEAL